MIKQIVFIVVLLATLGVFTYSVIRYVNFFKLTKPFKLDRWGKRIGLFFKVVIGQTKILRFPLAGLAHAFVFWGFTVLLFGLAEMVFDGLLGREKVLAEWFGETFYNIMIGAGDVAAFVVMMLIIVFLFRRNYLNIKRFEGDEMSHKNHNDAHIALTLILLVCFTLLGMNTFYIILHKGMGQDFHGVYPISSLFAYFWTSENTGLLRVIVEIMWWVHILTIFTFANMLPYSKHFHVFMSAPNVLLSRLEPLGHLYNMPDITKEVKLMMDPDAAFADPPEEEEVSRFGVLDVQDVTWKNYFDSLTCTQCGRCTSVCPANITGKKLSPRKIFMDLRARMDEVGPKLVKNRKDFSDNKSLVYDYVSEEELWACTLCNACAQECPVNINHPSLIVDMRRYLVMEESKAPGLINNMFSNIENNGAPWQYSPEDRMLWAEGLDFEIPLMADKIAKGEKPEYLFWVGSAGAFDDRYKKVTVAFAKILNKLNIDYAVLGTEESDSGDVARRAGNEMLFQMQAMTNVEILNSYEVKKIITCCPHDYNVFKNDYPDFDGNYEVMHHSQFLNKLDKEGKLSIGQNEFTNKRIVFHDPCYLGRANDEYEAPRKVLSKIGSVSVEMRRNRSKALCCGAGGGQMFKEAEKGEKEVYMERTEEALETKPDVIATACPFCMVMLTDGLKYTDNIEKIKNYDIAEIVAKGLGL
jgi:Fe-S oxidoreductase